MLIRFGVKKIKLKIANIVRDHHYNEAHLTCGAMNIYGNLVVVLGIPLTIICKTTCFSSKDAES